MPAASGSRNSATGDTADASGADSFNTATGFISNASGTGSHNVAAGQGQCQRQLERQCRDGSGLGSNASGANSFNYRVGTPSLTPQAPAAATPLPDTFPMPVAMQAITSRTAVEPTASGNSSGNVATGFNAVAEWQYQRQHSDRPVLLRQRRQQQQCRDRRECPGQRRQQRQRRHGNSGQRHGPQQRQPRVGTQRQRRRR